MRLFLQIICILPTSCNRQNWPNLLKSSTSPSQHGHATVVPLLRAYLRDFLYLLDEKENTIKIVFIYISPPFMFAIHSLSRMILLGKSPSQSGSLKGILPLLLVVSITISFVPPAFAATTPSLGAATGYGILSGTFTNTTAGTTVTGDVGFTTGPAVAPGGTHVNYGSGAPYATAGTDQGNALSALAAEPCTFTFAPGAINLSTDTTHGPIGVYTPGVYCSSGAMNIGGPLTLNGNGTYLFRPDGALTSTAGSVITLAGASSCNVFWTPTGAATLAANTTFVGTIIDPAGITVGANVTWTGRALAFGGTVTTDTDTMSVPTCIVALASSAASIVSSSSTISSNASFASSVTSLVSSSVQSSVVRSSVRSFRSSSASSVRSVLASTTDYVPLLPNTGIGPVAAHSSWQVIAVGMFVAALVLFVAYKAKHFISSKN